MASRDIKIPATIERPFVGETASIKRIRALALQIARSSASVLLTGETGTGKEVLARFIHSQSSRASRPFVAINCAALPPALVESELFGHEKGAFTGASQRQVGSFEEAHTGTLFLDEVSEIEPYLQVKLLRVLQEHEIRRLGGEGAINVDVRVVTASSRDLRAALTSRTFRDDLYYRLRIIEFHLPPLRDRIADLPLISHHFLEKYAPGDQSPLREIGQRALEFMGGHSWPGNIRELENVIHRATALSLPEDGEIMLPEHLPAEVRGETEECDDTAKEEPDLNLAAAVFRLKRLYVMDALRSAKGKKTEAALLLGISRRNLYNLLAEIEHNGPES